VKLIFEAQKPFTLITHTHGIVTMKAGEQLDWPEDHVRKLLSRFPDTFKAVTPTNVQSAFALNAQSVSKGNQVVMSLITIGSTIRVHSPLFGIFSAQTISQANDSVVWIVHPFIRLEVAIPREWILSYE